jgi:hypothetical protein
MESKEAPTGGRMICYASPLTSQPCSLHCNGSAAAFDSRAQSPFFPFMLGKNVFATQIFYDLIIGG